MFSSRVPDDRRPNRLAQALASARARGSLIDLTLSNPTQAGIDYPRDLLAPLASEASLIYRPEPFGSKTAREAIAADYARRGVLADADRIVLTASTSEGYSILFKLLCEPARSHVLTPAPSYPLFEFLADLQDVKLRSYPLLYDHGWHIDLHSLKQAITAQSRALMVVNPNNPTGSYVQAKELGELNHICAANHIGNYRADGQRGGRDLRDCKLAEHGHTGDRQEGPIHSNNIDVAVIGKQGRLRSPYRRSPPKRSLDGPPTVGSNWTRPAAVTFF